MATITFLIDSKSLPKGGSSISTPKDVGHPPFLLNGTQQGAGYVVPIKGGEKVTIYTVEANGVPNVVMAPCGIIAHAFKGEALTPAIMKDPMMQPIDTPNFDMQLGSTPDYIQYLAGVTPQWGNSPSNWPYWGNNPYISHDAQAKMVQTYTPFATFNGSNIVSGKFEYGVTFALTRDGVSSEYFYFDPFININS
ncbi:hypothetical protein BO221_13620 [Archangium sp. Cb G35]|uniref:hypothetical protein n=1 Tax=Archangium sp. Cb G35 TaxID=1920190 RepID=UPI000937B7F7|nr:hypothetical protein [Archangium sp. Cb G35]OJT24217.1 hypothetical protein BO221_13620 [Archangium sp. Cb G35]